MGQLTKTQLRAIREDIAKALATVEAKHSMKLNLGSIGFTANEFHGKLTGSVIGVNGVDEGKKIKWDFNASRFGLTPDMFGKKFILRNNTFTITELKPRSSRYPVIAEDVNGKSYKFTAISVKHSII
jgi:hypothetical protein